VILKTSDAESLPVHTQNNTVILCLSSSSTLEFQYFNHSSEGDTVPRLACLACIPLF